jgi:MFS family permease
VIFRFVGVTAVGFLMRGAMLPSIQESFTVSESLLGFVATAGTAGFICAVLVTGLAAGRTDIDRTLRWSVVVVVGVAMAALAFGVPP